MVAWTNGTERLVEIPSGRRRLSGILRMPSGAKAVVSHAEAAHVHRGTNSPLTTRFAVLDALGGKLARLRHTVTRSTMSRPSVVTAYTTLITELTDALDLLTPDLAVLAQGVAIEAPFVRPDPASALSQSLIPPGAGSVHVMFTTDEVELSPPSSVAMAVKA